MTSKTIKVELKAAKEAIKNKDFQTAKKHCQVREVKKTCKKYSCKIIILKCSMTLYIYK